MGVEDHDAELEAADSKCGLLFGKDDAFGAICGSGVREIFYKTERDYILMGSGATFDEAFEQAIPFYARFYASTT